MVQDDATYLAEQHVQQLELGRGELHLGVSERVNYRAIRRDPIRAAPPRRWRRLHADNT
jgi:hypothetical protein